MPYTHNATCPPDAKVFACWLLSHQNGIHIYSGMEFCNNYFAYARSLTRPFYSQNVLTRIANWGHGKENGWFCNTRMGSKNAYKITIDDETRNKIVEMYGLYDRTKARWNDKENGVEYY